MYALAALILFMSAFSVVSFAEAAAGINRQVNFQGKVVNTDGTNVANGSYTFLFCLYATGSPVTACTSGADNDAVWRESKSVTVTDGVFQTALGDTTTLPGSVDFNTDNIYLGINFNSNGQMTPLIRFTAAPYAFNADKIHGLSVTDTTGTLTVPNGKTISFSDAFSTTGAFPLTLTATASTTATLPSGTITLADLTTSQVLTNKTIGSTGLVFSGATTDITTASGEDLVIVASGAGVISLSDSVTVVNALAANGGITFDAATDTVGAHTLAGTIDASTNILTNIGNAGTDFIASTGALNLAGVLTANGGISLSASQSLSAVALSFVDLGLITQSTTANQGLRLPNAASATPSNPTSGEGYLAWDAAGNQLITYNGSAWTTVGGGGYNLIKNETTGLTARTTLAFLGAGVDCADNGGQTECTIAGGSGSDLQTTYDTDANGSNATISLTAADDSIIISNPASSGTDSTFTMKVEQLAAGAIDGLQITNAGTGTGLKINTTSTGSLAVFQNNGVDKVTFANNGALTINGADSSIVRDTSAQFTSGTVGSKLVNVNNRIEMSDGTPASDVGTITTTSQPAVNANIGAGSMSITRPDGKYFVINGGAVLTTSVYDPVAGTFTAGNAIIPGNSTGFGAGAIALPRANGMYVVVLGVAGASTAATANVDPQGSLPNTAGPALATAITGAGTVAYKRPDGKYLVTIGASTPGVATNVYDPVANTFVAGPAATGLGNWGAGALAIPRPDGTALMVSGGSASTTAIYNPYSVSATVGGFPSAGPKLDGVSASGTCGINGSGSVALKRQDGKFVILSKASVSALYDPVANTMTCRTSNGPAAALGDGAHAIPLQNGKFLIYRGANTTDASVYSQDTDSFAAWSGTTPVAITAGAHSILRTDGTWQTITGTNTCTNGCTFNYDTALPMSDPFPSQVNAATPTSGGSCTAGTHAYYVTFIMPSSVESELSNKSNIISCTAGNGTVALSAIPVGPLGTTARKVYRTPAGDVGTPQLLTTISDNTTVTYSDTTADGSLGAAYSVTAATTWYTTEDISNTSLSPNSTLRWNAQLEAVYAATRNTTTNTAFKVMQFFVKTAVNNSGCATPLMNAPWQEIQNSGDLIHAALGANCIKISVHFNRSMPKRLFDDRGVWMGNGNTVLRYDYVTPTLFSVSVDNSAVLKSYAFDFSTPNADDPARTTLPAAPTSSAPSGSGSCTSGAHFWFVTFVINGVESLLSPPSVTQTCSGSNVETLTIPTGPSGTTARKIYRTKAADLVTDTPFLVGTQSDNSTTSYADSLADGSLGAAFSSTTASGPTLSRGESSRVEMVNNQLTLPWGRITPTTQGATSALGFYMGAFGADHPLLNNLTGIGTTVIARDDKTFLIIEAGNSAGTADLYDPVTQIFTNQVGAGNVPTSATASGSFAIKRPDGKFLLIMGTGITTTACTTSGTATNIYDQYAPPGSRFTNGPCLSATAGQGAFAMQNADGTFTILHGNATTSTTIYDPVRNTMTNGPLQTTGTNVGGLAIPLAGPNNNMYKVIVGTTLGGAVATTTMVYNANSKIFTAGTALGVGSGSGAFAFQRQDGFWILVKGTATGTTSLIHPYTGAEAAGVALTTSTADRGAHVIPRADGTFLIIGGNAVSGVGVTTNIYVPWGGAFNATAGGYQGLTAVGPTLVLPGAGTVPALPTAGTPTAGGSCTAGAHFWKYSYVTQGIESPLSAVSATQTCVLTTGQTVPLTAVTVGPTGTTQRRIYRTLAGAAATAPYYYIGNINDNTTTIFSDTFADPAATNPYNGGGVGDGALSFQRPDGKWITIFGGSTPSKTTNIYDAGWYPDGQYMSEQMNVAPMAANSTLDWQQTPDQYVRMEVRSATSQDALSVAGSNIVSKPGGSIGNAANDNWVQVTVNFRRDFPTFPGSMNGVYNSTGGMVYGYRQISMPTVNSFQITNGTDLMMLQNNGLNVLRVTSNGNIMSSAGGGFFSGGADLAENYTSTQALDKGEVVMIDRNNPEGVLRSAGQYESSVLGVVSTAPGFVAGGYTQDSYPIALVGRVPVKISTENGPIQIGDYLTASSIPGYAMRATQAGRALGRALESFDETTAVTCPSQGLGNVPTTQCGSVMMFVNLTDYFGMPVDVVMAEQASDFAGVDGLDMREEGAREQNGLEIPSSMRLVVSAPAQERQTLAYLLKLRDERLSGRALPASEIFTDRIAASTSVITPTLVADRIFAKSIKADSIEGLEVYTNKIGSLEEKYATLSDASASDTLLNTQAMATYFAVMMKNIAVETLVVKLDGSILGKLSVGGDARFGGKSTFAELASFLGDTNFEGQVNFENVPTFSSDMGGFAVIAEGQQSVAILFDQAYDTQPIVSVSLTNELSSLITDAQKDQDLAKDIEAVDQDMAETYFDEDIRYLVTKKSKHGFTILLNKKAPRELEFSWVALSVKGGKTFRSEAAEDDSSDVEIKTVAPVEITIPVSEVLPSDSVVNPVEENTSVGDVLIDSASTSETETLSE